MRIVASPGAADRLLESGVEEVTLSGDNQIATEVGVIPQIRSNHCPMRDLNVGTPLPIPLVVRRGLPTTMLSSMLPMLQRALVLLEALVDPVSQVALASRLVSGLDSALVSLRCGKRRETEMEINLC